ncbi:MAG: 50S ribosomal protein L2 [Candidatus Harrisonbacteria bacterium CG10_big_fil_rev_8_21_14_0_10_40_38]|uniref:Large ribosomal subunit protein uL2 n=1 Tax=Candidatus Harrisonbacteria bacterium CG10_big_fil_rev_8_21_14_0_10_40_38 TaxID=1974583 RepID=A0A2H0USE0_9BACT|nr:MAG: 50S ribosomal protein L2 [Candidatus Harrisonbacteria bacterium CG10_big_fil_rev_8_21_14_0_10_40_38]
MKNYKATTPSRRGMKTINYREVLTTSEPWKPLTKRIKSHAGRNNRGVITMRHQGGGNKKLYRIIDFKQNKVGVPARIETIEYDPYRSAFISRVIYKDGERRYVLAAKDIKVGQEIVTGESAPLKPGNRLPLGKIPVGYQVHNVEMKPGSGGKLARSAGSYAEVLGHEGKHSIIKLSSKEVRKVSINSLATLGQVSNSDYNLVNYGKAGRSRWMGIRPTVRASAMNPVDHKYGGGEGAQPRGTRRPKDIWGNITGGRKTRDKKKYSGKFIMQRRAKKRK